MFYSRLTKWDEHFDCLPVHTISAQLYFRLAFEPATMDGYHSHFTVDIGDTLETKLAAIRCYQTQFPPAKAYVFDRIRGAALFAGAAAGFTAGETFVGTRPWGPAIWSSSSWSEADGSHESGTDARLATSGLRDQRRYYSFRNALGPLALCLASNSSSTRCRSAGSGSFQDQRLAGHGVDQLQASRVQRLAVQQNRRVVGPPQLAACDAGATAVEPVAEDGAADMGQMYPDLVGAAGLGKYAHQGEAGIAACHLVERRGFTRRAVMCANGHLVALVRMHSDRLVDTVPVPIGSSRHQGQILLLDRP